MQKLHIDEFYRNTVPEGTPDCEPDPGFNYDKASYIFSFLTIVAVDQSIEDYFQVFVDKIHVGFHQNVKCILPCHGGIYLDNLTLCTNTSLYEMALQLLPKLENDNTTLRLFLKLLDDIKKCL